MRRLLPLVALPLVVAACTEPRLDTIPPFLSPRDAAAALWCEVADGNAIRFEPAARCEGEAPELQGRRVSRALVANAGDHTIVQIDTDARTPRFLDMETSIPGITGVVLPHAPHRVVALRRGSIAVAATFPEATLQALDAARGKAFGDALALDETPSALVVDAADRLWITAPATRRVGFTTLALRCGDTPDVHRTDCALVGTFAPITWLTVDGTPDRLLAAPDGHLYVTFRELPWVQALRPFDGDAPCDGDACTVARLNVAPSCADGIDNDGDGRIDADDPQCFGPDDDEAGTPDRARSAERSLHGDCFDGVDNDGDGTLDGEDPDCDAPGAWEDGSHRVAILPDDGSGEGSGFEGSGFEGSGFEGSGDGGDRFTACTNGRDDDGDGLVDADDPDCLSSSGRSERDTPADTDCDDGFDNDLDGRVDADDPDCAAGSPWERPGTLPGGVASYRLPQCADGIDNDGDGGIDFPDDPDCHSASWNAEGTPTFDLVGPIALTPEGDLLLVVNNRRLDVTVFDTRTMTRIGVNDGARIHTTPGIPLRGRVPNLATAWNLRSTTRIDANTTVTTTNRIAAISSGVGLVSLLDLDRTLEPSDGSGRTEPLFARRDGNRNTATVSGLGCEIPRSLRLLGEGGRLECEDPQVPRLDVLHPNLVGDDGQPLPEARVSLPRRPTWVAQTGDGGVFSLVRRFLPWEWRIPADTWRLTWEGILPSTVRSDAIVLDDGWIRFGGLDPCSPERSLCDVGLDLRRCPDARALCDAPADRCDDRTNVCVLCPGACGSGVDLCLAGVVPGDRLILAPSVSAIRRGEACDPLRADVALREEERDVNRREYEIVEVLPDRLRVAIIPNAEGDSTFASALPSPACIDGPVEVRVRARSGWVVAGDANGHSSPLRAVGGTCQPVADAGERIGRARTGERFTTSLGLEFRVAPGSVPEVRDTSLIFRTTSGFASRELNFAEDGIGPSPAALLVVPGARGDRLVYVDAGFNYVIVYDASNLRFTGIDDDVYYVRYEGTTVRVRRAALESDDRD